MAELTDADRAAISARWLGVCNARSMQSAAEDTFLAGKAAGVAAERERCKQLETIIERAMTAHWDFQACFCGLCTAGHALGLGARENHLRAKDMAYRDYLSHEAGCKRHAAAIRDSAAK